MGSWSSAGFSVLPSLGTFSLLFLSSVGFSVLLSLGRFSLLFLSSVGFPVLFPPVCGVCVLLLSVLLCTVGFSVLLFVHSLLLSPVQFSVISFFLFLFLFFIIVSGGGGGASFCFIANRLKVAYERVCLNFSEDHFLFKNYI